MEQLNPIRCAIYTRKSTDDIIDWEQLLTSLGIMLGISGVRDIGMYRKEIKNDKYDKPDKFDKEV